MLFAALGDLSPIPQVLLLGLSGAAIARLPGRFSPAAGSPAVSARP
jgi:hypothetical protein